MKRLAMIVVIILLLSSVAYAENIDLSYLTDNELESLIDSAIMEQWKRKDDNYKYYTKDWDFEGDDGFKFRVSDSDSLAEYIFFTIECENGTDNAISLSPINARLNGWDIDCYCYDEISPHGRRRCRLSFDSTQAGISGINEIEHFMISFIVKEAYSNKELYRVGPLYYYYS